MIVYRVAHWSENYTEPTLEDFSTEKEAVARAHLINLATDNWLVVRLSPSRNAKKSPECKLIAHPGLQWLVAL